MATFKKRLSTKVEKNSDRKEVLIRLRHGKNIEIYAKSHVFIHPKFFSEKDGDIVIKSRIFTDEVREANQLKSRLDTLVNHIAGEFQNTPKDTVSSKWMQETIDRFTWPEQYEKKEEPVRKSFFELYDIFLTSRENLSEGRKKHYKVFINILKRYELYTKEYLDLDTLTPQSIQDIADFMKKEHTFFQTTPEGTRISFVSTYPETSTYVTVPAGTVFKGRISDSHPPYITGNGGLIVIKVDQIIYKGRAYDIDAKVSIANGKHIFFNNIKGKRMYFQSIPKALKPGTKFFKKMWRVTCNLAKNESGVEIILTPFSLLTGTVVYALNLATSPVLAIFYKGKSITIPSGSPFTIQLREDAVLAK